MEKREPTKADKVFAEIMGAVTTACTGKSLLGNAYKRFILWDAKNPIAYDMANERYYRRDTGEYI